MDLWCNLDAIKIQFRSTLDTVYSLLHVGGWSEDSRVMLNSIQDQVEVEVGVELGKKSHQSFSLNKMVKVKKPSSWKNVRFLE